MSDTVWSDPEWLLHFPVNAFTALDYFARSSFYDHSCNNEKIRQQGLDLSRLPTLPPGVEYVIQDTQEPHLYIIRKQMRNSPKSVTPLAYYYILDGKARCLYNIKAAFERIQKDLDPLQQYESSVADSKVEEGSSESAAAEAPQTPAQLKRLTQEDKDRVQRTDGVITNVLASHAKLLQLEDQGGGELSQANPEPAAATPPSSEQTAALQQVKGDEGSEQSQPKRARQR